jgi:hypothetical protein
LQLESFLAFENLSGTEIKRVVALVLALLLCAPVVNAAETSPFAKAKPTPTPSPSPAWPPAKGFKPSKDGNTYAKIPTAKELVGLASNDKALTKELAQRIDGIPVCEKFSCGAVQVVSLTFCSWWVITANVQGVTSPTDKTVKVFGTVRTTFGRTAAKRYTTILIVSGEPIELGHSVSNIKASCRSGVVTEKVPATTYTPIS